MVHDAVSGRMMTDAEVVAEMAEHVATGRKIVVNSNKAHDTGERIRMGSVAFEVLRQSSFEEFMRELPEWTKPEEKTRMAEEMATDPYFYEVKIVID